VDAMAMTYLVYGSLAALILGFVLGWTRNPINKLKLLRWITKRDYGIVYLVGKGGILKAAVVPFDGGVIELKTGKGKALWVFTRERIYLLSRDYLKGKTKITPKDLEDLPKEAKKDVKDKIIYHSGVVPVLFLSYDSFEPMEIKGVEGKVSPIELGSILNGWVTNQALKNVQAVKNMEKIMWLMAIGVIVSVALSYMAYNEAHNVYLIVKNFKAVQVVAETNSPVMVVR